MKEICGDANLEATGIVTNTKLIQGRRVKTSTGTRWQARVSGFVAETPQQRVIDR